MNLFAINLGDGTYYRDKIEGTRYFNSYSETVWIIEGMVDERDYPNSFIEKFELKSVGEIYKIGSLDSWNGRKNSGVV